MIRMFLGVMSATALLCTPASAQDAAKVLKEWEGEYELKSLTLGGEPAPQRLTDGFKGIVIKDATFSIKMESRTDQAKITIDPSKTPGHIDFTPSNDSKARLGLYKFEKGELTIIFAREGDRPANFDGKGKDEMKMVIMKKTK